MPTVDIPKPYNDGDDLTEEQLDECFEYIETLLNTTKLDSDNVQSGGIEESNLAAGSVTESKIGAAAVTAAKIGTNAVTTEKISDANVTAAKLASDSVTTAKIVDANVTTAKMADASVTRAKMEAVGAQTSSSSSTYSTSSTSFTDVTNLSVTITTTGRPVQLMLISDATGTFGASVGATTNSGVGKFLRGSTDVSIFPISSGVAVPPGGFTHWDEPAAGTYTYKMQVAAGSGGSISVSRCKLVAVER